MVSLRVKGRSRTQTLMRFSRAAGYAGAMENECGQWRQTCAQSKASGGWAHHMEKEITGPPPLSEVPSN